MIGREGYGFWDTTYYPIGGSFKRFGHNEVVENVQPMPIPYKGATHTGTIIRAASEQNPYGEKLTIAFGGFCVEPQIQQ